MTSAAKIRANRRNARRSTGPRSRAGKATAALNSRRHGLTLPVLGDPSVARDVVALARRIETSLLGHAADAAGHALACRIAEAVIDFDRVRRAKLLLFATLDADPGDARALVRLSRLDRYAGHAFTRRLRAIRAFDAAMLAMPATARSRKKTKRSQRGKANHFNTAAQLLPRMAQRLPRIKRRAMRGCPYLKAARSLSSGGASRRPVGAAKRAAAKLTKRSQPRKANEFSGRVGRSAAAPATPAAAASALRR